MNGTLGLNVHSTESSKILWFGEAVRYINKIEVLFLRQSVCSEHTTRVYLEALSVN